LATLLVFWLGVALGLIFLASVLLGWLRRLAFWRLWGVLLASGLGCAAYVLDTYARPVMDDGPFHGEAVSGPPSNRAADNWVALTDRLVLESWDADSGAAAPTVCVATIDRRERGCLLATGYRGTRVRSVVFDAPRSALWNLVVPAQVNWTYGQESSVWIFRRSGRLREYWYSW
jgi:hypothetical protein